MIDRLHLLREYVELLKNYGLVAETNLTEELLDEAIEVFAGELAEVSA